MVPTPETLSAHVAGQLDLHQPVIVRNRLVVDAGGRL
jgi:hypothetical protein